jgi:hypothetical protein
MSRLDDWFAELTEQVDDALDIEGGLADVMLAKRIESLDQAVDAALDIEAGLRAILPESGLRAQAEIWIERLVLDLTGLSPLERLTLRSGMRLAYLEFFDLLAESWETCGQIIDNLTGIDADRTGREGCDRVVVDLSATEDLAHQLGNNLNQASISHLSAHARLAYQVGADIGLARCTHPDGADSLRTALSGALEHAQHLQEALYLELFGTGPHFGAIAAGDLDELLGAAPPATRVKIVWALRMFVRTVTDFTDADLADLDLHSIDLRGVQWSVLTTRWPPDFESEVREVSVQIDPEGRPDLYEVKGDPRVRHTVR